MWGLLRRWPLLGVALLLLASYVGLAEWGGARVEGPATFMAGLAATTLGAWLYACARDDHHGDDDPPTRP